MGKKCCVVFVCDILQTRENGFVAMVQEFGKIPNQKKRMTPSRHWLFLSNSLTNRNNKVDFRVTTHQIILGRSADVSSRTYSGVAFTIRPTARFALL